VKHLFVSWSFYQACNVSVKSSNYKRMFT
jgi:hypothetical protein